MGEQSNKKSRMRKLSALGLAFLLALCHMIALGAPFAKKIPFTQPDGTRIILWGQGDEFYAVFETLEGYTVVFNQQTKTYEYAQLSAGGGQLVSTAVVVGQADPAKFGLKQHLRIAPEAAKKQAADRFASWDQAMQITRRWTELKAERRLADLAAAKDSTQPAPPSSTTTGSKSGLTLLIDFSDDAATIAQAEIMNFCNGDSYTDIGTKTTIHRFC